MDLGIQGKVALITGGSEGIGKATAVRLATEGANVVICARRPDILREAADEISNISNTPVLAIPTDVSNPLQIDTLVKKVVNQYGKIDILISNAGQGAVQPFDLLDDNDWEKDIDVKLYATIRLARKILPQMKKQGGGRIIIVTNVDAKAPGSGSLPASVTRAAGIAATKALSKEYASHNILVNTVCIGFIKSGQNDRRGMQKIANIPEKSLSDWYEDMGNSVPIGRVGEAYEAADMISFLVSKQASYITGSAVNIDGGLSAVI